MSRPSRNRKEVSYVFNIPLDFDDDDDAAYCQVKAKPKKQPAPPKPSAEKDDAAEGASSPVKRKRVVHDIVDSDEDEVQPVKSPKLEPLTDEKSASSKAQRKSLQERREEAELQKALDLSLHDAHDNAKPTGRRSSLSQDTDLSDLSPVGSSDPEDELELDAASTKKNKAKPKDRRKPSLPSDAKQHGKAVISSPEILIDIDGPAIERGMWKVGAMGCLDGSVQCVWVGACCESDLTLRATVRPPAPKDSVEALPSSKDKPKRDKPAKGLKDKAAAAAEDPPSTSKGDPEPEPAPAPPVPKKPASKKANPAPKPISDGSATASAPSATLAVPAATASPAKQREAPMSPSSGRLGSIGLTASPINSVSIRVGLSRFSRTKSLHGYLK
ncbi:uncharacterized protein BJ171DRAFT_509681 [Polychytrium aggregatum]|uniref:uncharacterized protein n=1 Tax=Polychytrium aggregatum TaxID=110093 RepID=UPI0022FEB23A|nr:uncharacterized protein BJ171DRAFT_509681 [Polychytrium aggregatum]KAI9203447.1 hypothetical protein BJ171DRAFT_509681 [Polychytrium aggregatum]